MKELVELRTRNSKRFKMPDGKMCLELGNHSHYKQGNNWNEVDMSIDELPVEDGDHVHGQKFKRSLRKCKCPVDVDEVTGSWRMYFGNGRWLEIGGKVNLGGAIYSQDKHAMTVRKEFPNFIHELIAYDNGIKLNIIVKRKAGDIRTFRFPYKLRGIKIVNQNILDMVTNEWLGRLNDIYIEDADNNLRQGELNISANQMEIRADLTRLAYPLRIDPSATTQGSSDATMNQLKGNNNFGGVNSLFIRTLTNGNTRALEVFDFSSDVPVGSIISSSIISLSVTAKGATTTTPPRLHAFSRMTSTPWNAGTSSDAIEVGAVCWNYKAYNTIPWNSAGASSDFTTDDEYQLDITGVQAGHVLNWIVTNMTQTVLNTLSGILYGLLRDTVDGFDGTSRSVTYASSDHVTPALRPYITIIFSSKKGFPKSRVVNNAGAGGLTKGGLVNA